MKEQSKPKLATVVILSTVLIILAVTNPSSDDFREWYVENHGLAGALISIEVKRENRFFFSTFSIDGDGFLSKRSVARGFAGMLFEVDG